MIDTRLVDVANLRYTNVKASYGESEDILRAVGLEVKGVGEGAEGKRPYFLTDGEHAEIVSRYAAGESMERIAEAIARSSATVDRAIRDHNRAVEEYGLCPRCSRAKSKLCE